MKKLFALVVAAAMGLSSVAFAAETSAAPAATTTTAAPAPAKASVKHVKKHHKAVAQKAQAAKKHHKAKKVAPKA